MLSPHNNSGSKPTATTAPIPAPSIIDCIAAPADVDIETADELVVDVANIDRLVVDGSPVVFSILKLQPSG